MRRANWRSRTHPTPHDVPEYGVWGVGFNCIGVGVGQGNLVILIQNGGPQERGGGGEN